MAFEPFDLGKVLMTAQAPQGARQQAENDKLRNAYLGQQMTIQKQEADAATQARDAKNHFLAAQAVESAPDPIAAAKQLAPEMVTAFEQQHGAGSFDQLPPDVVKQIAGLGKQRAAAQAGINLQLTAEEQARIDQQNRQLAQQGAIAQMQNATSRSNAELQAQTARATNAATVAATQRGQDISAETARRGQDLTAQTAAAKNQNGPQQLDKTWGAYQQAKSGLLKGLEASETGPLAGRIPAVTTAQQTAEGGVSAMAPVLKQIFRVAGEGTFTDKDQELLMKMVPTRTDNPEARQQKIDNIDNIIRAKLGKPVPESRKHVNGADYLQIGGKWYVDDGS